METENGTEVVISRLLLTRALVLLRVENNRESSIEHEKIILLFAHMKSVNKRRQPVCIVLFEY